MLSIDVQQGLERFFSKFKSTSYKKRDIILHADEPVSSVFYIKSGFLRCYKISENGEELTLTILKSKDLFPATGLLNDSSNNYYFEAITPIEVYKAPREQFLNFLKENSEIFYEVSSDMMVKFEDLINRMEYLVISRAYTKVASTLLSCAQNFGEQSGTDIVLTVPLTHRDIANLAGITRETTCLEMKKLEKKGLISRFGKLFVVRNIKALAEESTVSSVVHLGN